MFDSANDHVPVGVGSRKRWQTLSRVIFPLCLNSGEIPLLSVVKTLKCRKHVFFRMFATSFGSNGWEFDLGLTMESLVILRTWIGGAG